MAFIPPLKIINETTEEGPKVLVLEVGAFIMERDWFLLGGSLRIFFFFMGGGGERGGEGGGTGEGMKHCIITIQKITT